MNAVNKETLLAQASFLLLSPANPKQATLFQSLQPNKVTSVTHAGTTFYLVPMAGGTKAYVRK